MYICTGNVFRSPVAEEMTKQLLADKQISVESAGILKYRGAPLPQEMIQLAERYGIDLSKHKPRQVSTKLVDDADLILVFDRKQITELAERSPQSKSKIHSVKSYASCSDRKDMEDLWNRPVEAYERFMKELKGYMEKCVNRIELEK